MAHKSRVKEALREIVPLCVSFHRIRLDVRVDGRGKDAQHDMLSAEALERTVASEEMDLGHAAVRATPESSRAAS